MAGRRTSLASLKGKVEDVPGKSDPLLLTLPLDTLHCTRFNPRRNFGTDEELQEFGHKLAKEQLQPAVVVSKAAYLKLWPDEADNVGAASYVIANGERRYRASLMVGRATLEVVHREDVAKSKADFLDAVQSENNDRKDLDPIERAIAIETMVTELGGSQAVADYYGKTKAWVSQQRKLLKLVPELQQLVSVGEMPVRVARDIAGQPADRQVQAWEDEVQARQEAKERPRARAAETPRPFTAVNDPAPANAAGPQPAAPFTAVNSSPASPTAPAAVVGEPADVADPRPPQGDSQAPAGPTAEPAPGVGESVPEPRAEQKQKLTPEPPAEPPAKREVPWDEPRYVSDLIRTRMDEPHFFMLLGFLLTQAAELDAEHLQSVLKTHDTA